ncbi:protein RER1A-like isoform X1 [Lycium ferocissimum]|uniref:protein RER1A-like isoform X1 n=1 Tax=Lycium ferocissimum TaxID=112874 RepID=UPI002815CFF5|nr:protein RER1A-like isoform X1 [Lycium ferocissimum]
MEELIDDVKHWVAMLWSLVSTLFQRYFDTSDLAITHALGVTWSIVSYPYYRISSVYQHYLLDKISPYGLYRWIITAVLAILYSLRVCVRGFYPGTYLVLFHFSGILCKFLSPHGLPDPDDDGPVLPIKGSDEFKPLIRQLPEFNFWYAATIDLCLVLTMTFFPVVDVKGCWPLIFISWCLVYGYKMAVVLIKSKRYKYNPFTLIKQKVAGKGQQEVAAAPVKGHQDVAAASGILISV